jgi:hypothetical protein
VKKLMSIMIAMSLLLGVASVSYAQNGASGHGKKRGGGKRGRRTGGNIQNLQKI